MIDRLFENNQEWAQAKRNADPAYFTRLAALQAPEYLWIGCSDSRVSANEITGLLPGEVFVHRNIANVVNHTDLNCLSVIQYAVDVLKVQNIIVCGHYGCAGVRAALSGARLGLIDNWLRHIQDVQNLHARMVESQPGEEGQWKMLCELNVVEQVIHVAQTTMVRDAWGRGQPLAIHGLVYGLNDGRLRDLGITLQAEEEVPAMYGQALERLKAPR